MIRQFATFRLGDGLFGVDVLLVREINQQMDITAVPLSAPWVRGLINLRGQVVTVFDLRVRLGMSAEDTTESSHIIILKTENELSLLRARENNDALRTSEDMIGLLVDDIGDVVEIDNTEIETPPANAGGVEGKFILGVLKLEAELMLVLKVQEVLALERD
jgi:purine-binding chemotaxis protein CheW